MTDTLNILCVEDNELDFSLIERELKKMNKPFRTKWVITREEFITALEKEVPDVILCDHNLPGFSSDAAFGILQNLGLNVPFLLVTATINEDEAVKQVNRGIDDYILKDRLQRLPSAVLRAVKLSHAEKDREKYFRQLVKKERRFRGLVEQSHESVILCDQNLTVKYVSPAFTNIFFLQRDDYEGRELFEILPVRDDKEIRRICGEALQRPGELFFHEVHLYVGGRGIWLECSAINLLHAEHVKAFVINIRDITERVTFQRSLERTQAILSSIINHSEIAYVLVNKDFRVVTFNTTATHRYFHEFRQTLKKGDVIFDYLPEERKEATRELYQTALEGKTFRYEAEFAQHSGGSNWYEVNVFPINDKAGNLLGIIVATGDITPRKTAEIEREKMTADLLIQNKNLEQFSYIISHNLRSPVANILGLAELLKYPHHLNDAEFIRCAEGMAMSAKNIDRVILDLNEILQTRNMLLDGRETISFTSLLNEILNILDEQIRENNVTIKAVFEADEFYGIRSYMHSIFLNLISNSIKYRRPEMPAQLKITTSADKHFLRLRFSDNGIGIDLKLYGDKLFGLYKKINQQSDGRGMGLYMVKTQCELMGGTITVQSAPGEGTTFILNFPIKST